MSGTSSITTLSDKLYEEIVVNLSEEPVFIQSIKPYFKEIKEVGVTDFMSYNYSNYSRSYLIKLTFYTYDLWESNTTDYWKTLMVNVKGWEGASSLIEFLHKYLEVNALKWYLDIPEISLIQKTELVRFFSRAAIFLWHDDEDAIRVKELAEKEGFHFDFKKINIKLINDGIEPAPNTKDQLRALIADVKCRYI